MDCHMGWYSEAEKKWDSIWSPVPWVTGCCEQPIGMLWSESKYSRRTASGLHDSDLHLSRTAGIILKLQ